MGSEMCIRDRTEPLIMEENEILKVQAASGAVDVVASILEINREDR